MAANTANTATAANTPAYSTDPAAANGLWTVANTAAPSNFLGYDNQAHQGITFNAQHPEAGAKYVVENYLTQNKVDPSSPGWGTQAAADLNKLYGSNTLFSSVTGPDGTSRLSYGNESVASGGASGGGPKGAFMWNSSGGQGQAPAANTGALNYAAQPSNTAANTINTASTAVGGGLGQVNSGGNQAAITAALAPVANSASSTANTQPQQGT